MTPLSTVEGIRVSSTGISGNITVTSDQKTDDFVEKVKSAIKKLIEKFDLKIQFTDVSADTIKLKAIIKVHFFRRTIFSDLYKKDNGNYKLASGDFSKDFQSVDIFLKSPSVDNAIHFAKYYFLQGALKFIIT